ncbi:hypothetical protein PENTCL1PPCAC_5252, partial [Pristionchus entomophagus]
MTIPFMVSSWLLALRNHVSFREDRIVLHESHAHAEDHADSSLIISPRWNNLALQHLSYRKHLPS